MQAVSTMIYMYTYKLKVDFVLQLLNVQTPVMLMAGKQFPLSLPQIWL